MTKKHMQMKCGEECISSSLNNNGTQQQQQQHNNYCTSSSFSVSLNDGWMCNPNPHICIMNEFKKQMIKPNEKEEEEEQNNVNNLPHENDDANEKNHEEYFLLEKIEEVVDCPCKLCTKVILSSTK